MIPDHIYDETKHEYLDAGRRKYVHTQVAAGLILLLSIALLLGSLVAFWSRIAHLL